MSLPQFPRCWDRTQVGWRTLLLIVQQALCTLCLRWLSLPIKKPGQRGWGVDIVYTVDLCYCWETHSFRNSQYFKGAARKPVQLFSHRGILSLLSWSEKKICTLLPELTLSLSFEAVCYKNMFQNRILDKSCHRCTETPWRLVPQQVFNLCLQIHILKDQG